MMKLLVIVVKVWLSFIMVIMKIGEMIENKKGCGWKLIAFVKTLGF